MTLSTSILGGLALLSTAAVFSTQGASQPVRSAPEYFVTAEGDNAHLWVREGTTLRVVGHGACEDCPLHAHDEHSEDDGHEHKESGGDR